MTFRSAEDALRERVENAEKELAAQGERIGRVAEIESQLEDARRQIREAKLDTKGIVERGVPWLVVGLLVGGGLVYVWSSSHLTALRTELDVTGARAAGERRVVEERAEAAEAESAAAAVAREDAEMARDRATTDLTDVLRLVEREAAPPAGSEPGTTAAGWVSFSESPAHPVGTRCVLVQPTTLAGCVAELRCGAPLVGLGCAEAPREHIAFAPLSVAVRTGGMDVVIAFGDPLPTTAVISTPSGVLPDWAGTVPDAAMLEALIRRHRGD